MGFVHKVRDMFTTSLPAYGHGVNTYGMMGAGIAKLIANRHPEILAPYKKACQEGLLVGGGFLATSTQSGVVVLNLASQDKPGKNARYEWVDSSVQQAIRWAKDNNFSGFALPRIASDIGGLEWTKVKTILEERADEAGDEFLLELWSLPTAK